MKFEDIKQGQVFPVTLADAQSGFPEGYVTLVEAKYKTMGDSRRDCWVAQPLNEEDLGTLWVVEDDNWDETFSAHVDPDYVIPGTARQGETNTEPVTESGNTELHPNHYQRLQSKFGIEAWDLLDELFPNDPDLWNAGKYLLRAGSKDDLVKDLRKMVNYVERRIGKEDNGEDA